MGFLSANTNILCKVEPFCTYTKRQDTFPLPFVLTWGTHTSSRMVELRLRTPPPQGSTAQGLLPRPSQARGKVHRELLPGGNIHCICIFPSLGHMGKSVKRKEFWQGKANPLL